MASPRVVAFVMAGGEGTRLRPLTDCCAKPALPFAGGHRIIDFVLSNLFLSGVRAVYVLVQYHPAALVEHISNHWVYSSSSREEFVLPVFPRDRDPHTGYRGTADAVACNLDLLEPHRPEVVAVFAADHIYRMDVRQMLRFHMETGADATVAAVAVPRARASAFGVLRADADDRIREFQEKPADPAPIPGAPDLAFASMGNYLFRPGVLIEALREAAARDETDFGRHVLPRLVHSRQLYAYDFRANTVPGTGASEERGYWRDVGDIESYVSAHWDLLGTHPRFRLVNRHWPIFFGGTAIAVARAQRARIRNSLLGPDARASGASLRNSVLQRGAQVEPEAELEQCIVMEGARVRRGARLRRAVITPGSTVAAGACIGYDPGRDAARYPVTPTGIVIVPPDAGASRRESAAA